MQTTEMIRQGADEAAQRDPIVGLYDGEIDGYADQYRNAPSFIRNRFSFEDYLRAALMLLQRDFIGLSNSLRVAGDEEE